MQRVRLLLVCMQLSPKLIVRQPPVKVIMLGVRLRKRVNVSLKLLLAVLGMTWPKTECPVGRHLCGLAWKGWALCRWTTDLTWDAFLLCIASVPTVPPNVLKSRPVGVGLVRPCSMIGLLSDSGVFLNK